MMVVSMIPLTALTISAVQNNKEAVVKGSVFTSTGNTVDVSVSFDFDWLTKGDNTAYHSGLAAFSAIASEDAYFREKDAGTASENKVMIRGQEEAYTCAAFLTAFGFDDVRRIETYDKTSADIDKNDSATFLAGHRLIDGKDVFIFVFRGAFSSGEWLSAFDIGNPAAIGDHPCWTDPDNVKSFDVAANAAWAKINDYIGEFGHSEAPDSILLTGHSRGGAIANILGTKFEKAEGTDSFTYTFSSPKTTVSAKAGEYKTIFNIQNADDFYGDFLPFRDETLTRYGIDLSESFGGSAGLPDLLKTYEPAGEYLCMTPADRNRYRTLFGEAFPNRTDIYQTKTETLNFETAADAQKKYDDCVTVINGFKLDDLCSVTLAGNRVLLTTTKASLLKSYSMVLAYGTHDMVDYIRTLFPEDEIAELLYQNLSGLTNAHQILKSFLLCGAMPPQEPATEEETDPSESPDLGDADNRILWIGLILAAAGISAGIPFAKKRKE